MKRLQISPEAARTVFDHAVETTPDECCGVLLGPSEQRATEALPAENVHSNPRTEYEIDPQALLEAVERADEPGTELVGFYHSHPRGAAAFSETDVSRGSWAGKAYLLLSLAPITFVGGVWNGESFERIPVHLDRS